MPGRADGLANFDELLRAEVAHVLEDPVFERSPTQSKLLKYLSEETLRGRAKPSQFSVAVDGLGRSDDYDLHSDSYPRVQVSRLRQTLANVYARIEPVNELCLFIRKGEYRLYLAPRETAYPAQRARQSDFRPSSNANTSTDDGNNADAAIPAEHPVGAKLSTTGAWSRLWTMFSGWTRRPRLFASVIPILLLAAAGVGYTILRHDAGKQTTSPPLVHLQFKLAPTLSGSVGGEDLAATVRQLIANHISTSFVVGLAPPDTPADHTGYNLSLELSQNGPKNKLLDLTLVDGQGSTVYRAEIPYIGNWQSFKNRLDSDLTALLAPNGIIAHHQYNMASPDRFTDYDCFIRVEVRRGWGRSTLEQVNSCLEQFPSSQYSAFWLARKSFILFNAGLMQGIPLHENSDAMKFYREAFAADDRNAYANALAAKLSLAQGDCENAMVFANRSIAAGRDYPALITIISVDSLPCTMTRGHRQAMIQRVENIAYRRNEPDILLSPYLTMMALELGDRKMLEKVSADSSALAAGPKASEISKIVLNSVRDPEYRKAHKAEFENVVNAMVWNPQARAGIMRTFNAL